MNVKELIEILETKDQKLTVVSTGFRGCSDWLQEITERDIEEQKEFVNFYENGENKEKKIKCLVIG